MTIPASRNVAALLDLNLLMSLIEDIEQMLVRHSYDE